MAKNLHNRLARLERIRPQAPHPSILFIDDQGCVLDDGSADLRPWVGHHHTELPGRVTVFGNVDPLRVLGLVKEGEASPNDHLLRGRRDPVANSGAETDH